MHLYSNVNIWGAVLRDSRTLPPNSRSISNIFVPLERIVYHLTTMTWTLVVGGLSLILQLASGFVSAGSTHRTTTTDDLRMMGGYDATIGAAPSTPIQFFTLPGNTCPYAQRTHIALVELGVPFDVTEVSGMPKVCIREHYPPFSPEKQN